MFFPRASTRILKNNSFRQRSAELRKPYVEGEFIPKSKINQRMSCNVLAGFVT